MLQRVLKTTFFLLVILHVLAIGFFLERAYNQVYEMREIPEQHRHFTVTEGVSLNQVLTQLEELDLSPAPIFVRLVLAYEKKSLVLKKGAYTLPERASTLELLDLFHEGKIELFKLTLPEGLDRWQTAAALAESGRWGDKATFLALIEDPSPISHIAPKATSLEGFLYPETYLFPPDANAAEIIQALVREFEKQTADLRQSLPEANLSILEWVSLASLIEKESSLEGERPRIASVFHNRLERGMLLQCDPTIIYGLKLDNRYRGKIYKSDIRYPHPYNTYVNKGIPPGPIANPSLGALAAALQPEPSDFFYFVAKTDGSHHFSKNLREHNQAVRKYLRGR